jgi:hypothetical protein
MIRILKNYWKGFKRRWNITNDWQVVIILIVFSLTGTTTMYVHREFNKLIGLGDDGHILLKIIVFLVLVLPLYNTLLIIYGSLLGQFKFFKFFIIKFFSNIFKVFKRNKIKNSK